MPDYSARASRVAPLTLVADEASGFSLGSYLSPLRLGGTQEQQRAGMTNCMEAAIYGFTTTST